MTELLQGPGEGRLWVLYELLLHARREGSRSARLMRYAPELVDVLVPRGSHHDWTDRQRADEAEAVIRRGIGVIKQEEDEQQGQALAIVLRLAPGTKRFNLTDRRSLAAELLSMSSETFRTSQHEGALLFDLAVVIDRLLDSHNGNQSTGAA